jgi:broad specificity phosphatase PhoE
MPTERRQTGIWRNLFLVRHGESTANEINRFAGAIDAPLTDLGCAQARRAGRSWKAGKIDQIFVSPLTRARQTAEILLDTLPRLSLANAEVRLDERLGERHFGDFTLQNKTRLQRRFGLREYEASLYSSTAELHGGETFEDFRQRVLEFLKTELYPALRTGRRILIVAHKYVIELLSRLILRLPDAGGHDLRLPNARILPGSDLGRYVQGESHTRNLLNDWIVVHHSAVLAAAAGLGLVLNASGLRFPIPSSVMFVLLSIATAISLARISLANPSATSDPGLLSANRLIARFVLLPWGVTGLGFALASGGRQDDLSFLLAIALLLTAPAAITALTLSRSAGGMILPSVYMILVSTAMSSANTIGLLWVFDLSSQAVPAFVYIGLSVFGLLLPMLVVGLLRKHFPISVAKFAEDHASSAVVSLGLFVVLSFQNIELSSFYPSGLAALALGLALRLTSARMARHRSLYSLDDFFSMSYPNIFLVIILGSLLGSQVIMELATWFLVPMFALAPLDDVLIRRLREIQPRFRLLSYLRVDHVPSYPSESAVPTEVTADSTTEQRLAVHYSVPQKNLSQKERM